MRGGDFATPRIHRMTDASTLRWIERQPPENGALLPDFHPVLARLLANRGFRTAEEARAFLNPKLTQLADPEQVPGCAAAAALLVAAVNAKRPIVIYGDYDVDGVTASAVLFHVLALAGARVATYVPDRFAEGYGLNAEALLALHGAGAPLIVSVDCGITAVGPVAAAKAAGAAIIITDHHQMSADGALPDADAIVHPGLPGSKADPRLCGVGVAYKLAWAFAKAWCGSGKLPAVWSHLLVDLLALVALGTIADVGEMLGENRVLVSFGLRRLSAAPAGAPHLEGLRALVGATRLENKQIDDVKVGFTLAPQINAVGRMGHAREAVELFTSARGARATELAQVLAEHNEERKAVQKRIEAEAEALVRSNGWDGPQHRAIVVAMPACDHGDTGTGWHSGVVGIVASKLVEKFHRPALVGCINPDGSVKFSARSVSGVNLHAAFGDCGEHLDFGGHAMAAGGTIKAGALDALRAALSKRVAADLAAEDLCKKLIYDLEVHPGDCTLEVFTQIAQLAPFGIGNPTPRVRLRAKVREVRPLGQGGRHLNLRLEADGAQVAVKAWGAAEQLAGAVVGTTLDMVGKAIVNDFNGRVSAEVHWEGGMIG